MRPLQDIIDDKRATKTLNEHFTSEPTLEILDISIPTQRLEECEENGLRNFYNFETVIFL